MLAAKTNRSSLSDTHNGNSTPTTPRSSKLVRKRSTKSASGSPALLKSSSNCSDRFPNSIDSRPTADKLAHPTKTTALQQPKLAVLQQELKRTRDQLASVEQEKLKAVKELNDANKIADENYEKLNEAIVARNNAEENSKIARLKADKMEQVGIKAIWIKEEESQKEIEHVRNQHNLDVLALVSTSKELEKVKQELTLISDSRDRAISYSHDAMKTAEINAEKVDILSYEINQLNVLLDSRTDSLSNENKEIVEKLNLEIDCLKSKLEKTKLTEVKLVEMEVQLEVLNTEVNAVKRGELDASQLVDELKKQVELLLAQLQEAKLSHKASTDLSDLISKQLNDCMAALRDSESELGALREKVNSLEFQVIQHKDLKNLERQLKEAQMEASEMKETVVVLKSELQNLEQERLNAIENEKIVASGIKRLSEEKKKLMTELETSRDESENSKKAMEALASALRKVSSEARETREILLERHTEIEDVYVQTEHLRLALKNTEESYQVMLDEARYEIICLKKSIERNQTEAELNVKELNVLSSIESAKEESEFELLKGADCQVNGTDAEYVDPSSFKERLKELSIFLAEPKTTKPKNSALSHSDSEYEFLDANAIHGEIHKKANDRNVIGMNAKDDLKTGSMSGTYKCDVKPIDDELDSRKASRSFRKVNIMSSQECNGDSLKLFRVQEVKVKKALLNKLSNLLKKRSNFK